MLVHVRTIFSVSKVNDTPGMLANTNFKPTTTYYQRITIHVHQILTNYMPVSVTITSYLRRADVVSSSHRLNIAQTIDLIILLSLCSNYRLNNIIKSMAQTIDLLTL